MFLIAIGAALIGGLLAGGRVGALVNARLQFLALLLAALVLRFGTQLAIARDVDLADTLRLPLYAVAFSVLAFCLWLNRGRPGLLAVGAGVIANGIAVVANGGWMP